MKNIKFTDILLLLVIIFIFAVNVHAQNLPSENGNDVIEKYDDGTINWTTKKLEATGCAEMDQSAYQQKLAAEVSARANLLKVLDGVRISAERIVRDGRLKGEISKEKVEGFLRHSRVTEPTRNSLGLTEVKAYVYLDSNSQPLLLPPLYFAKQNGVTEGANTKRYVGRPSLREDAYTGLILDASGLEHLKPALLPKILSDDDAVVYQPLMDNREYIMQQGACSYANSLGQARNMTQRIGSNPLVIRATGVSSGGINLYVSKEDAEKILETDRQNGMLGRARVVVALK